MAAHARAYVMSGRLPANFSARRVLHHNDAAYIRPKKRWEWRLSGAINRKTSDRSGEMLIAQLSDFHVAAAGERIYGSIDTNAMLGRAVEAITQLDPPPDIVIASGDLVQSGKSAEYAEVQRILAPIKAGILPVMGNHDSRRDFLAVFANTLPTIECEPFIQYVIEKDNLRIIVLDTVTPRSDDPSFCATRANWLRRALSQSSLPVLLVMHHPPFETGIPWMDPASMEWTHLLGEAIRTSRSRIVGIVSGHIHRAIHTQVFGICASSCPSTAHQVALNFNAHSALLSLEPPGFQIHRWNGSSIITYTVSVERMSDVFSV